MEEYKNHPKQDGQFSQKYEELRQEALNEAEQVLQDDPLKEAVDKKKK